MSTPDGGKRRLPHQPSEEHLKKQAKRRARMDAIQLAEAQHRLAVEYGFASWPKLMAFVDAQKTRAADWYNDPNDNLPKAANAGDVAKVRAFLESGNFTEHDLNLALGRVVCGMGDYTATDRWILADLLIDAGADVDGDYGGQYGPIVFGPCEGISYEGIKYLIDRGADVSFAPIPTKYGPQCPLSLLLGTYSRGKNEAKHKAIDLLLAHGAVIPPEVTPEVFTIHRGDAAVLGEMIDKDRSLIRRMFREMPYGNIALAGATLLHCAVEFGEIECIDAILSRYRNWGDLDMNFKADVIDGVGGQTPIWHAINTNGDRNFYVLEYLIGRAGRFIDMGIRATWRGTAAWAIRDFDPAKTPHTPLEYAETAARNIDPRHAYYKPKAQEELALLIPLDRRAQIRKASEAGDIATVRRMLDEHPELLTGDLWPGAIHKAKSLDLVRLLLDRGLSPNDCPAPRKPLHLATYYHLADIIELLIARGADVNYLNSLDETPLDLIGEYEPHNNMSEQGQRSREALLKAGAKHRFHTAIRAGDLDEVRRQLDAEPALIDTAKPWSGLFTAARTAQLEAAKLLLERGAKVDGPNREGNTPLWFACQSSADAADRIAVATLLLDHGARVNAICEDGSTPLHFAAWRGPIAMVELLISRGAKEWIGDKDNKKPIDYVRENGQSADHDQIVELLNRPVIRDPNFRAAVTAIQTGNLPALKQLLADHPNLVHDSAIEPACYAKHGGYFANPRLLWFVANNPNLIETMPANSVEITKAIVDAGAERRDIEYTIELVATSRPAREQGLQRPLIKLLATGRRIATNGLGILGHRERDAMAALLESGTPLTAAIAAGMGRIEDLKRLLPIATPQERHEAFSLAVINDELECARLCLDAGAEVNRLLACHTHSTAAHQAVANNNVPMLKLLVERGADLTIRDTLWNGTPLGWAQHTNSPEAAAYLRSIQP